VPVNERNDTLKKLDRLVGRWDIMITLPGDPPMTVAGRASFEWLDGVFLVHRSDADDPNFPTGNSIIGSDDTMGSYTMLYSDSRGVTRIYQMSLEGNVLKMWRDDPEFAQRFTGTISADGSQIDAKWENSTDGGTTFNLDFNLTYTKVP
jgi:hypothetical protein